MWQDLGVSVSDYLALPDPHLDPVVAQRYDEGGGEEFDPSAIALAVEALVGWAEGETAVEFAIGTGRLAIPLARAGISVLGIDFSEAMVAELQRKPGSDLISVTIGDMTKVRVCDNAAVVYLVYNTISNLRTQRQQVACFANAAAHLRPGGRFVIENQVPRLRDLPPGETIVPFDVSPTHLGFDEYIDLVNQISISHHYHIDGDRVRTTTPAFRYVWPSELDLMAELAGLQLESRWAGWDREPFTGGSTSHVSAWRKPLE